MDATLLLAKDHRKVESLLKRYRNLSSPAAKRRVLAQVTVDLSRHMTAEETELYPVLRETIEDGRRLMEDAIKEHREARGLLAELQALPDVTFDVDAKVATLRQAIDHHVSDEEGEIFPKARKALGAAKLRILGARLMVAKKAAATEPPPAAARNSPGASMRGMAAAAVDRVSATLRPQPERSRSKAAATRSRRTTTKKSIAKKSTPRRRTKTAAKHR